MYQCAICLKIFTRKFTLDRHQQTLHPYENKVLDTLIPERGGNDTVTYRELISQIKELKERDEQLVCEIQELKTSHSLIIKFFKLFVLGMMITIWIC